jgi:hypothetical protein
MRRFLIALALVTCVAQAQDGPTVAGARPACVTVAFSAPYRGVGYNHVVSVHNACAQVASCTVSTDVNPSPQAVTVPAGATQDVTTFIGSPARVFVPTVACTLRH